MKHKACILVTKESLDLIKKGQMDRSTIIKNSIKNLIEGTSIDDLEKVFKIEESENTKDQTLEITSSYR
jgi:hypothetical protein